MKKKTKIVSLLIGLLCLMITSAHAQIERPVHWAYGKKVLPNGIVEVHLQATMDQDWHIYAQKQVKDAICIPTKIVFAKSPDVTLIGIPIELGKKELYRVDVADVTNAEYAGKVDFVQKVKVKPGTKEIKGVIHFQACTHDHCLPEDTVDFTIPLP